MWSLVGYSPLGSKELDMTEQIDFHFHFQSVPYLFYIIPIML